MTPTPESFLPLKPRVFHVLLALHSGPQHGYRIKTTIRDRTSGTVDLDPGGLYRLIGRLEDQALLTEAPAHSVDVRRHDSRRRYYALTELGRRVVRAEARRLTDLVATPEVAALTSEVTP